VEVDPQLAVVCIHRDPLDAPPHGRLALGERPLPKCGAEARGEPRRLSHGLGHLGLGERIMFQGLQLGLQVLACLVELGQAPIDEVEVLDRIYGRPNQPIEGMLAVLDLTPEQRARAARIAAAVDAILEDK